MFCTKTLAISADYGRCSLKHLEGDKLELQNMGLVIVALAEGRNNSNAHLTVLGGKKDGFTSGTFLPCSQQSIFVSQTNTSIQQRQPELK